VELEAVLELVLVLEAVLDLVLVLVGIVMEDVVVVELGGADNKSQHVPGVDKVMSTVGKLSPMCEGLSSHLCT